MVSSLDSRKNIYIVDTPYHILITIIKTIQANRIGNDSIIIMRNAIPPSMTRNLHSVFKEVISHWKGYDILIDLLSSKIQQKNIPILSRIIHRNNQLKEIFSPNFEIFIYDDNSYLGCWLNNNGIYYNHIEDGLNNFMFPKYKNFRIKLYDFIYKILGISWEYWGTSKYIKSIEVNENKNLRLKHNNIIEQNREQMFKALSSKQIDVVARVFNYQSPAYFDSSEKTLLLTQPLSEDKFVSHSRKKQIYKYLIDKYAVGKLYIKVHPREKEDYAKIFPNAVILGNQKIPFELFQLKEKLHFKRAITASSTAIDAVFCAEEKISMGHEWVLNFKKHKEQNPSL